MGKFRQIIVFAAMTLALLAGPAHANLQESLRVPLGRLLAGANAGNAQYQALLGLRYLHGVGVRKSGREAIRLFCAAATRGSGEGAFQVGAAYIRGHLVRKDTGRAAQWLGYAARRGHAQAARMLAILPPARSSALPACPVSRDGGTGGPWKAPAPPAWAVTMAKEAGVAAGVDPAFILAIMAVESAFNSSAVSPKGARGLMQLMPGTAARFNVSDPHDAAQGIRGGTAYLAWLLRRYDGDLILTAAAYNAGEGAVEEHGGVPPYRETRDYIRKIASIYAPMAQAVAAGKP